MEQNDVLDSQTTVGKKKVPGMVNTLAVFSYIGSGILALLFLWFLVAFESVLDTIDLEEAFSKFGEGEAALNIIRITIVILLVLNIGTIIGPAMMQKGKKVGFYIYAACNGIWVILMVLGGTPAGIVLGLISLLFIIGYATKLKHLG
ncbi:MAG: hypothetical protein A2W91_13910 [Bacteroidetes bacterium GWF2_38_335]|nr:MAG: hypothetical protein A2W91_13910 [Bacteroidetes bacterium GWF2_38_335]OFY77811.1 MAG: hypothetical protein A2281_15600 [Bacteroidetes bacterium RIFOXYA12_FULL_38_20]HBS87383.1 hypothetical protein [Bacteroidales bacterium]